MNIGVGLSARFDRISIDGRYLVVPMDHGTILGPITGLVDIKSTINSIMRDGADAVLTHKGVTSHVHPSENSESYIAHANGSTDIDPDESDEQLVGSVEDALRVGADAVSSHINVGSDYESDQMTQLADLCFHATDFNVPVLAMSYTHGPGIDEQGSEALVHVVRLAEKVNASAVRTVYSGNTESSGCVIGAARPPVVTADGSRGTDHKTVEVVRGIMDADAADVSMGRSIFQHGDPEATICAVSAVIRDDADMDTVLKHAGLGIEA